MNRKELIRIAKTLFKQKDYIMYPYQEKFCLDPNKFKILNKSRQVGMSDVCACWTFINAACADRKELVVSPSLRQSKHFMDYVYDYKYEYEELIGGPLKIEEETKSSLIFPEGGEVYSLPNSPSTVRGFPADDIYFDEYAHFLHGTDKQMMTALLPSISRGGNVNLISTPFGTENDYYLCWHEDDRYSKHLVNWTECPDLDHAEIKRLQLIDPMTYNQEYNNQFLEEVDEAEFPFSLIKKSIDMELEYEELTKNKIYVSGADIGRKRDLTALAVCERVGDIYYLRYFKTMQNVKYDQQKAYFEFNLKNYTFEWCKMDATGIGNMLVEGLQDEFGDVVVPIEFDNQNKQDMVMGLKELMFNGKLKIPNDPQLINNIRSIKRMFTSGGMLRFDSDRNSEIGHADLFWALALSVYQESGGTTDFFIE